MAKDVKLKAGEGKVVRHRGRLLAIYRDFDDRVLYMSPYCPHLKCVVEFNLQDQTWCCPCHGSRGPCPCWPLRRSQRQCPSRPHPRWWSRFCRRARRSSLSGKARIILSCRFNGFIRISPMGPSSF